MWGTVAASWECAFRGIDTTPSPAFATFTSKRTLTCQKRPPIPVHCCRRESGMMSSYVKTKLWAFSFLSTHVLPSTDVQRFPRQWEWGLLSCPPIALCTLLPALDQSLFPSLTNVCRNPSTNRWPRLSIIWNNSLTQQWCSTQTNCPICGVLGSGDVMS